MSKLNKIEVFSETYYLRKTFDIVDTDLNIYGYDVIDDKGKFLMHYNIENPDAVISEIKWDIYRVVE
jgi:hypothetical protein